MKCVRVVFVVIGSFLAAQRTLGKTIAYTKNDDHYIVKENDIADDVPLLPIEGGLLEQPQYYELTEDQYNMRSMGMASDSNYETPEETASNMERFYDVDNPFYMGSGYFGEAISPIVDFQDTPYVSIADAPEGTIISESYGQGQPRESESSEELEDENVPSRTEESSTSSPYWVPPAPEPYENPYMMAIPAQFQGFPMFTPEHYHTEYDEYEEQQAAELEKERKEKEDNLRDKNVVTEEGSELPERRVRRGLSRHLNLRFTVSDYEKSKTKNIKENTNKGNVVLKNHADCGWGRGGNPGRNGNGRGNGGGNGGGNGVDDAVGAAQNAAGAAQDAAGSAQNAAGAAQNAAGAAEGAIENAADNLRLTNGRRQRNGNGRRGQ